jgi:hypothetical protein
MRLIREAVISSEGLLKSGHRPSAWWFPVVSPNGDWFNHAVGRARYYLEQLG